MAASINWGSFTSLEEGLVQGSFKGVCGVVVRQVSS